MALSAESPLPPPTPATPDLRSLEPSWSGRDVLSGVVWFIAIFIFGQVVVVIAALAAGGADRPTYTAAFIVGAAVEVAIGVLAYQFSVGRHGGGLRALGVRPVSLRTALWAAAAFGGALTVSLIYGVIVQVLHLEDQLSSNCAQQIPDTVRHTRWLLALASVVVIAFAPVFEELFFRGFVFPGLAKAWGIAAAIVVSGLLFAAAHLDYKSFVPIAGVGMVFAFCYWRSGNIFSTMASHMAFNSTSIAVIAAGSCDAILAPRVPVLVADLALAFIRHPL